MQAFSTLVTLAPIHDFIFRKQLVIEPYKTLLKQSTQKRREKKNNQPLALDNDHFTDNASQSHKINCYLRDLHVDEFW